MKIAIFAFFVTVSATAAQAAVLTFDGNICYSGQACTNGQPIDQSYGDIAGQVDVQYDYDIGVAGQSNLLFWDNNYSDLTNVAYGAYTSPSEIFFKALTGYSVTLSSLKIGAWLSDYTSNVTILDGLDNVLFNSGSITVNRFVSTAFTGSYSSVNGIKLRYGPYGYNVGLDNIEYSASAISPVPLPATALLLGGGLAGLFGLRRRNKTSV